MLNAKSIKEEIDKTKKPALYMNFVPSDETNNNSIIESRIGGTPFLSQDKDWPNCPNCRKEMEFVFQLREKKQDKNIFLNVFFFCECEMKDYKPNFTVYFFKNPSVEEFDSSKVKGKTFKKSFDILLEPYWNLPNWISLPYYNENLYHSISNEFSNVRDAEKFYDRLRWDNDFVSDYKHSLIGGHPEYVSDPKFFPCVCCGKELDFYFQLNSDSEFDIDFGDAILYSFRCPRTEIIYFLLN